MFKKRGQGLSITVIIAAVIGLIVLVVVVAVLTGKLGAFGKGLEESKRCESVCTSLGKNTDTSQTAAQCGVTTLNRVDVADATEREIPGSFSDVVSGDVCCCT